MPGSAYVFSLDCLDGTICKNATSPQKMQNLWHLCSKQKALIYWPTPGPVRGLANAVPTNLAVLSTDCFAPEAL